VRSTTLRDLIHRTRQEGHAKEVHVRIGSPPVIAPCFYGIDMSTLGELFAPHYLSKDYTPEDLEQASQEMADRLGADSLRYLPVESVGPSIGLPHESLCTACVTTQYPTETGSRIYADEISRPDHGAGRAFERTAGT